MKPPQRRAGKKRARKAVLVMWAGRIQLNGAAVFTVTKDMRRLFNARSKKLQMLPVSISWIEPPKRRSA